MIYDSTIVELLWASTKLNDLGKNIELLIFKVKTDFDDLRVLLMSAC